MLITLARTLILYAVMIFSVRLMGKRQIGQLQPSELVVTIFLSEIAAIPIDNNDIPVLQPLIALIVLVGIEVVSSYISVKSYKFRTAVQGHPIYVIRDGKIDTKQMKALRFTVDDLMEALRQKDVFDINEVEYAVVETNGNLSVKLKIEKSPVSPEDLGLQLEDNGIPSVVVSDGKIAKANLEYCNMTEDKVKRLIRKKNKNIDNILIMTVDKGGNIVIVDKGE